MNKDIIKQVIEHIINNHNNKFISKCNPNSIKQNIIGFNEVSEKYGLTVLKPDQSGSAFTLYDHKNDVYLDFSNAFMRGNIIDVKNNGDKEINLEDIIRGYDNLPVKVKKKIGLIKYHHLVEGDDVSEGTEAFSRFIDTESNTVGTITMPDYFFTKYNGRGGVDAYDFVLAHEAMHNYDYKRPSKKTFDLLNKYFNGEYIEYQDRYKLYTNYIDAWGDKKFTKSNGFYETAVRNNSNYIYDAGGSATINRASDYGRVKQSEDFAEAGAMIITGYKNPDNPYSVVKFNNRNMQFREWVTVHPYQAQALIKELYGDKLSINEVLKLGVSTLLIPTS